MTREEQQLILSSFIGDCYWMKGKRSLTLKFGGYVKNYLEWKRSLITTLHKSNLWGSVNKKNILYEFTISKEKTIWQYKNIPFEELVKQFNGITDLGLAILFFDNGSYHKQLKYYELSIGKIYSKKFAEYLNDYLNKQFTLHGTVHKQLGCKGYKLQYKVFDTPTIANILNKYNSHDYIYKIPSSETINVLLSRYKDIPKDLEGKRAYDIVRSLEKVQRESMESINS